MNSKLGEFRSMKMGNTIAKVIIVIIKEMYNNRIIHYNFSKWKAKGLVQLERGTLEFGRDLKFHSEKSKEFVCSLKVEKKA